MPISNRDCFLVNLRDGLVCRRCGVGPGSRDAYHRGFEYHHRVHRSRGGADVAENLVLVCQACHRLHHDGKIDLSTLPERAIVDAFACRSCGERLMARAVEMNCGWYRCDRCGRRTHLFDHFGDVDSLISTRAERPMS